MSGEAALGAPGCGAAWGEAAAWGLGAPALIAACSWACMSGVAAPWGAAGASAEGGWARGGWLACSAAAPTVLVKLLAAVCSSFILSWAACRNDQLSIFSCALRLNSSCW